VTKSNLSKQKNKSKLQDVFDTGNKFVCKNFVAFFLPSPKQKFSSTIIASKKVGNAVKRNRAKRRLREITRLYIKDIASIRLILIARTNTYKSDNLSLLSDSNILARKINNHIPTNKT
jgi:ribonuclease P protein component